MRCENCKYYVFIEGKYHCIWFEVKISRVFPMWKEKFERGEIKFADCGYFKPKTNKALAYPM